MKNGEILELYEALSNIKDLVLPIKVGYTFSKDRKILQEEAQIIYEERIKIIKKYGEEIDGNIVVKKESIEDCNKEIVELMKIENEIQLYKVPLEWCSEVEIPMEIIDKIECIIEIEKTQEI